MKFVSLFAGIGGFDLGLERAGMKCVGQVETNKFCNQVLSRHWPNVKRIGDIRNVNGTEFGTVDLICGGFPCQPFSAAGNKKGKSDNRYLWPEMLRVIKEYRPTWVIGENVVGIINLALDTVCADLETENYQVEPIIIPACGINAPHKRERVWFLAHSNRYSNNANGGKVREEKSLSSFGWQKVGGGLPSRAACPDVPKSNSEGLQRSTFNRSLGSIRQEPEQQFTRQVQSTWEKFPTQSPLCRRDDGVSNRVDRIKAIGNAVVPQIAEIIGCMIMNIESGTSCAKELGRKKDE